METVLDQDAPLGQALLEADGQGDSYMNALYSQTTGDTAAQNDFAPQLSTLHSRLRQRLGHPLKIAIPHKSPVAILQEAYSVSDSAVGTKMKSVAFANALRTAQDAVSSTIQRKDNEQFLDSFRYSIITSNLLHEHTSVSALRLGSVHRKDATISEQSDVANWSLEGVAVAIIVPAAISWILKWSFSASSIWVTLFRLGVLVILLFIAKEILDVHSRRQRLCYLREEVVKSVNVAVINLDAFDKSSAAAVTLIQEVEAVSRGYHLNGAVPPVTILEDKSPNARSRRCVRLRRLLQSSYAELIPQIIKKCEDLKDLVNTDNFERQIEIHEVAEPDIQEAFSGATISEIEDQESLRALRTMHLRFSVLRRVFLCFLLSLEANGNGKDIHPWKAALEAMESLAKTTGDRAEQINDMLREDEMHNPVQSTPTHRSSPEKERYRQQLRKTNELASELRTMQTKLLILRDDVSRLLEGPGNATSIPALFAAQTESIAQDLKALNQTYDSWKTAILPPSDRADRRISWTSSGLRSPISLGGLTVVDELGISGGPSDALRALSGESSGSGGSPVASLVSDEEVFEAIAVPRVRRAMTREEKIFKLQEEETKRAAAREQRMSSSNMMRELESVITARSSKRMSTGRILATASRVSSL